jgi:DNA-binding transcriptional MerR regulator
MRIGELARRTGVSERSLRYYETQGLLDAERTPGGQRRYGEWAVDRVVRVQALYAAGLSSTTIARLLPCMRDADGAPSEIATRRLVDDLTTERDRIDRAIRDLLRSREVLDEVIALAAGDGDGGTGAVGGGTGTGAVTPVPALDDGLLETGQQTRRCGHPPRVRPSA